LLGLLLLLPTPSPATPAATISATSSATTPAATHELRQRRLLVILLAHH
jgi:hypothetical protein